MSDESAAALETAVGDYRAAGDGEDPEELQAAAEALKAAAQAHLDASRPPAEVAAEYKAVVDVIAAGEPHDSEALDRLGTELTFARQAEAYAAGSLPGTGHSVSTGIGT